LVTTKFADNFVVTISRGKVYKTKIFSLYAILNALFLEKAAENERYAL